MNACLLMASMPFFSPGPPPFGGSLSAHVKNGVIMALVHGAPGEIYHKVVHKHIFFPTRKMVHSVPLKGEDL